jgi:CubicO group peptidase (beta-lactamase class C family)
MKRRPALALCFVVAAGAACGSPTRPDLGAAVPPTAAAEDPPHFASGGLDAESYGASEGYPIGDECGRVSVPRCATFYSTRFFVGAFSHYDQIFESRLIRRGRKASRLARIATEPSVRYEYQAETLTLDDYLARNPTTGLLIARGDTIFVERYQYARNDQHRFTSHSMAKTVTAMLIGAAIAEGHIHAVDDRAATYVPALADTEYGRASLRHLLQMSSGVSFVEKYSGTDDMVRLYLATFGQGGPGGVDAVKLFNERIRPAGTMFSYASAETQVLGLVLRQAIGRPLADYFQEKIWEPIGAEADATWLIDRSGQEAAWCCLNAVLRDYARLGLLLAHDGNWRGRQVIPAAWLAEATRVSADQPHLRPSAVTRDLGYGYQVWILAGKRRMFALLGAHGQAIYVDPSSRLVMVHTAVRKRAEDPGNAEGFALWRGVVEMFGG